VQKKPAAYTGYLDGRQINNERGFF